MARRSGRSTPASRQLALNPNAAKAAKRPGKSSVPHQALPPTGAINTSGPKTIGARSAGGAQQPKAHGTAIAKTKALPRRSGSSASGVQGAK